MLDLQRPLALPDFPDVLVYRDHERPLTYYVLPPAPALEFDDNGRPEARVLLYVKKDGTDTVPTGGQVSLTTILVTAPSELARIKKAIETLLTPPAPPPPAPPPPPVQVQVSGAEWVSGTVSVVLTPSLTLSGQPSLFSDNRCALMSALTADQAKAVREQWGRRLPDAEILYDMVMRVASTASATAVRESTVTTAAEAGAAKRTRTTSVEARTATSGTHPIAVKGPLWTGGLERRFTEIDLSR